MANLFDSNMTLGGILAMAQNNVQQAQAQAQMLSDASALVENIVAQNQAIQSSNQAIQSSNQQSGNRWEKMKARYGNAFERVQNGFPLSEQKLLFKDIENGNISQNYSFGLSNPQAIGLTGNMGVEPKTVVQNTNYQGQMPQVAQGGYGVPDYGNPQNQMPQVAQGGYGGVSTPLMPQDKYMQSNGMKKRDADNQKKGTTKKVKKTKGNSGRKRESWVDEDERINAKYRALNNSLQQGYSKSRW